MPPTDGRGSTSGAGEAWTDTELALARQRLMRQGMAVNDRLVRLLAGKDATLATLTLPWQERPGLRPEEKLRRYLDRIVAAQRRLGGPDWGRCVFCADRLAKAAVLETPWLDGCAGFGRCARSADGSGAGRG
jgi:hypothetical protein